MTDADRAYNERHGLGRGSTMSDHLAALDAEREAIIAAAPWWRRWAVRRAIPTTDGLRAHIDRRRDEAFARMIHQGQREEALELHAEVAGRNPEAALRFVRWLARQPGWTHDTACTEVSHIIGMARSR